MRVVNDRRSSARVTVRGEALVHAPKGTVRCRCLDLSPGGMSLVCPQPIKPKQRVRVESSFKGQRLVLDAVVVRKRRSREGQVLGLRFEGLEPRAREQLADVVRSMEVQAALAMQACAFVGRLPVLEVPEPEAEAPERAPWGAVPPVATPVSGAMPAPVATPPLAARTGGTQETPVMAPPRPRAATPSPGGTQEMPAMVPARPRMATPSAGDMPEMPAKAPPRPRVAMPSVGGPPQAPARPRAATPSTGGPPDGRRLVGLEEGWAEDELVTTHYRPSSEGSSSRGLELDEAVEAPDAADRTAVEPTVGSITLPETPAYDWEVGAPVALAELVDTDAGSRPAELELDDPPPPPRLDRTMLAPRPPEPSSSAAWLGPVRTGKTMVVHVQDLVAAYAPPLEPELDLPEEPVTTAAPTAMPRLSDELQAALDRLRRREDERAPRAAEPPPQPAASARRNSRSSDAADVRAVPRRDDMQVRALYHAALATLGDPERGDGS